MTQIRADESLHLIRLSRHYAFITIYHVMLVIPELVHSTLCKKQGGIFSCIFCCTHGSIASLFILTERNKTETSIMLWRSMVKQFMLLKAMEIFTDSHMIWHFHQ